MVTVTLTPPATGGCLVIGLSTASVDTKLGFNSELRNGTKNRGQVSPVGSLPDPDQYTEGLVPGTAQHPRNVAH